MDDSPLVTRLLELWSQGKISASQAAEIAHLASLEGANSQEIMKIAKCGNFQQCPGNSHRDMMQLFLKGLQLCDPWPVTVEVKEPKSQKLTTTEASVMLPHLLFSSLYEHYRDQFAELFAVKECASFWHNLEKKEDPRLVPPITLDKRVISPSTTIPIFVHGDGVEFVRDSSLMTFSWGSMLSQQSSLATSSADSLAQILPNSRYMAPTGQNYQLELQCLGKRLSPNRRLGWKSLDKRHLF